MTCIILAGGLGTRLRGVIGDAPKCMAPVNEKPFLEYLIDFLERQGCTRLVLSLGYRHEAVLGWIASRSFIFPVDYAIEHEPLGTGGGIRSALLKSDSDEVCILNGDTFFDVSLPALLESHRSSKATATLALKPMRNFERYGTVTLDKASRITSFREKQPTAEGLINGGIYVLSRDAFFNYPLPEKFSFEQDFLQRHVQDGLFAASVSDGYFIDIGVPEDYERAQQDFKTLF